MTDTADKTAGGVAPSWVQITLGKTRLLFPQAEFLSQLSDAEIRASGADTGAGAITWHGTDLPVYNFNDHLCLLQERITGRRDCACFSNGGTAFGLLCDKVEPIEGVSLRMVDLPACMGQTHTPILSLAIQGSRVLCVSNVRRFSAFVADTVLNRVTP